jgi:nucleoside-diphosphate-sugar epimerase
MPARGSQRSAREAHAAKKEPTMKILVTGATGYIGGAAAKALHLRGYEVSGLARSESSAAKLAQAGLTPVMGDFVDAASLANAVKGADVIVSTASIGSLSGNTDTFRKDRDAVRAMLATLEGSGKTLLFTSGSAVVGVFADGEATETIYDENVELPLAEAVLAPPSANVHPMIVAGLRGAMAARIGTEKDVLAASGIKGIVMRPGLVYGNAGSYDLPQLIAMARKSGVAPHLGSGRTRQGYVHIDELAELFSLAVERAPKGAVLHGVVDEVTQRDLAAAVSRMIGGGDKTERYTLEQMFEAVGSVGISLSLNKRLSNARTREVTGWSPTRTDILHDVEFGSYAS